MPLAAAFSRVSTLTVKGQTRLHSRDEANLYTDGVPQNHCSWASRLRIGMGRTTLTGRKQLRNLKGYQPDRLKRNDLATIKSILNLDSGTVLMNLYNEQYKPRAQCF